MVGSAKGTSMITFRTDLPGKLSRTSTQAMIVPITMLTRVTSRDWVTVNVTAAHVWLLLSTEK